MLNMKTKHQSGVTLIEMMVGIVVGLIVLWGMSSVYINSSRGSRTTTAANALNQDLRAVMDIMVGDVRRAGYWSTVVEGVNPFTVIGTTNLNVAANCVLYSYDATHAGGAAGVVNDGVDYFGFRLSGAAVQTLIPTAGVTTAAATCANDAVWENLTDERAINVTGLTFNTINTQCMAYHKSTYNPTVAGSFTTWKTTAGTGVACAPGASGAPGTYPAATNTFVESRVVTFTLAATSIADPTLPARTLTETVYVRNNRLITPP